MTDLAGDLCAFIDASPTPSHAVAEMAGRLRAAGFTELDERAHWSLAPGGRHFAVRDGSIAAFVVGAAAPSEGGFRLVGAHTDSPGFAVRPTPDLRRSGYDLVGVEPYGGVLLHTWFDRDLTVAGRVAVRDGDGIATRLVRLPGAPLRMPNLSIHLYREIREDGFRPDPQRHTVPVLGLDAPGHLLTLVAAHAEVDADAVLGHDLVLTDTQPAAIGGRDEEFVFAPRLDNLASCHAGLHALLSAEAGGATAVLVANDHEEVGSSSAEGAQGSFLEDVLRRIVSATEGDDGQAFPRACANSRLVSCDMAHGVHPNYADRHEPGHRPRLGGGPVVKSNANQSYATDAIGMAHLRAACADAGVAVQHFVTRADLPCGSTIGPITATRLGVATVDVGNPMLSMHSCREQAAVGDIAPMIAALTAHLSSNG